MNAKTAPRGGARHRVTEQSGQTELPDRGVNKGERVTQPSWKAVRKPASRLSREKKDSGGGCQERGTDYGSVFEGGRPTNERGGGGQKVKEQKKGEGGNPASSMGGKKRHVRGIKRRALERAKDTNCKGAFPFKRWGTKQRVGLKGAYKKKGGWAIIRQILWGPGRRGETKFRNES